MRGGAFRTTLHHHLTIQFRPALLSQAACQVVKAVGFLLQTNENTRLCPAKLSWISP